MNDVPDPTAAPPPRGAVARAPSHALPFAAHAGGGPAPARSVVRLATGFYGLIALFAVGYAFFTLDLAPAEDGQAFLGLSLPSAMDLLAAAGVGLVVVGVTRVGLRLSSVRRAAGSLASLLGPLRLSEALALAVLSAVGEELLFRGALWPHLGLVGTTCLFALVHVLPRKALWGYPLFALLAGLLLGVLRDASGSVLSPMLAHFVINGLNLAWLGRSHARLLAEAPVPPADARPADALPAEVRPTDVPPADPPEAEGA